MRLWLIATLLLVLTTGPAFPDSPKRDPVRQKATEKALQSFAGTWEIVSVRPEGATKSARRLVFRQDGSYAALDQDGKELWAGTFELDSTTKPMIWDHRSHEAKTNNRDVLGIYELEGDSLRASCVAGKWVDGQWNGKPRPKDLRSDEADVKLELRRVVAPRK